MQVIKQYSFRFNNPNMDDNIIDDKSGKVLLFKEINVVSTDEESARKKAARPKIDNGSLLRDWVLISKIELNDNWSINND